MKAPFWPVPISMDKKYLNLDRIRLLLEKLGNPEKKMPAIFHITGTNGKGSVSSYLKYILEDAGYKVHRYTSPHLVDFNERIEIAGEQITDEYYNELANECKQVIEKNNLDVSYFEIITSIAFMAFAKNEGHATILEVGMGGRLDATNVIENPLATIITTISLDHMKTLGDTVEKIAVEKAGIMKSGSPCIISNQEISVYRVLDECAKKAHCQLYEYEKKWMFKQIDDENCYFEGMYKMFKTPLPNLLGAHQIINAGAAIAALFAQNKIGVSEDNIRRGLVKTVWPARLQDISDSSFITHVEDKTKIYLDGGHNEDGARIINNWLNIEDKKEKRENIGIIAMLTRKDTKAFAKEISKSFDKIILLNHDLVDGQMQDFQDTKYKNVEEFKQEFIENGFKNIFIAKDIFEALKKTKDKKAILKRVVICGSLYLAGEILALIKKT